MDNYSIKSVAFGGFDKQDVIQYIEAISKSASDEKRELEAENERLRDRVTALEEELSGIRNQLLGVSALRDRLQSDLRAASANREKLEPLRNLEPEITRLRAEVSALRPDAEAFAQFRERLGSIECEARKRADDLETAATERTRKTLESFQEQYQGLVRVFENTASYVSAELRKIEVTLTQLPRAMDQAGADLAALTDRMNRLGDGETP